MKLLKFLLLWLIWLKFELLVKSHIINYNYLLNKNKNTIHTHTHTHTHNYDVSIAEKVKNKNLNSFITNKSPSYLNFELIN